MVTLVAEQAGKASPIITQQEIGLEKKLYNAIKDGAVATDEEAAAFIYGSSDLSANYRMLKSRLRKKVLNTIIFLDQTHASEFEPSSPEIHECELLLHQVRKLYDFGEYKVTKKLTEQILSISVSSQLTEFTVKALEYQRGISLLVQDKPKFTSINQELQLYYNLETAERKAKNIFYAARIELTGKASSKNQYLPQLVTVLHELKELWQQTSVSKIFYYYHSLRITQLEMEGNYEAIFGAIQEAEKLLKQGVLNTRWYNARFNNYIKTYAYIRTNQYALGLAFAQKHLVDYNPKSFNWFAYMENYIQLALYAREYKLAVELMAQVTGNDYLNSLSRNKRERWELHRRYLLLCCGDIKEEEYNFLKKEICAFKILSTDKEGSNLPIIIYRLIDNLIYNKFDALECQPELINKYISRHLRGEKAERVRIFLRLLLLVVKEEGDLNLIQLKSKPLLEKLSAATKSEDTYAELEIVPYEHLWELVINGLQRK